MDGGSKQNQASSEQSAAGGEAPLTGAERALRLVLRLTAFGLFLATIVYALGPFVPPAQDFFHELPFVANSVVKVSILGLLSLYAAGDVRRRTGLVLILILAHLVSVAAMGSMLLFAETGTKADLGFAHPDVGTVLLYSIGLDGVITAGIAAFYLAARWSTKGIEPSDRDLGALTPSERLLRGVLAFLALGFALAAVAYEIAPFLGSTEDFARELPFVTNSVVRMAALAMVCAYAAARLRRNMAIIGPLIVVEFLSVAVSVAYLIHQYAGDADLTVPLLGGEPRLTSLLWGMIALDVAIGAVVLLSYRAAWRRRHQLGFLWPISYRGLTAAAEVLMAGANASISPRDVADRVEAFLQDFRARRRWLYRVALGAIQLAPLVELRPHPKISPPLSELDTESRRRFLEAHFERLPMQGRPRFLKNLQQVLIRICMQLTYAGYYGDERSYDSIGYAPFTQRPRYAELDIEEPGEHPLEVERPEQIGADEIEAEICIVGSGAGGAILAHELAERGCDVLILERGQYVEPRHFSESEVEMIGRLYADGLMQQTEDWRFTVLQGSCVGGSTTVNNAVCFPPPDPVLASWNDPFAHDANLDLGRLAGSVAAVEDLLTIGPQAPGVVLNRSAHKYVEGVENLDLSPEQLNVGVVNANIKGCYGSGYCNIGCRWGKKLSMLETVLPKAQAGGKGSVRILAECEVERIFALSGRPEHVTGLRAKFPDGRALRVRAETYVLAAGAVASSYLLLRSGLGRRLPVGERFSANMGAPLTAEFEEEMEAYDGLQISHYGVPGDDGYVFETWFNPPVSQALNLPGWFETHAQNMSNYKRMMAVGVLVGTASNGQVRRALTGGPGVVFRPQPDDLATLARGLKQLGRILLATEPGPKRLLVNTWRGDELVSVEDLDELDRICADPDYISLGTGHPQGGNTISSDPKRGVVDPEFKVHGFDNLHVCDASVFPTSLTVNPQLTVMALAHYAAPMIASRE
ncbi:MAG: GMC family oxidoreductase N-terminal domain-containing protein [Solirubrobacterales bacterium]